MGMTLSKLGRQRRTEETGIPQAMGVAKSLDVTERLSNNSLDEKQGNLTARQGLEVRTKSGPGACHPPTPFESKNVSRRQQL